jgi:hypothetical protein
LIDARVRVGVCVRAYATQVMYTKGERLENCAHTGLCKREAGAGERDMQCIVCASVRRLSAAAACGQLQNGRVSLSPRSFSPGSNHRDRRFGFVTLIPLFEPFTRLRESARNEGETDRQTEREKGREGWWEGGRGRERGTERGRGREGGERERESTGTSGRASGTGSSRRRRPVISAASSPPSPPHPPPRLRPRPWTPPALSRPCARAARRSRRWRAWIRVARWGTGPGSRWSKRSRPPARPPSRASSAGSRRRRSPCPPPPTYFRTRRLGRRLAWSCGTGSS